jgi:AcrR family transcriptional regulator
MATIWAKGFSAASLSDLIDAMELSKSPFYNSFGNKQQALLDAIDAYTTAQAKALALLLDQHGFRDGLNALFETIVNGNNDGRGCLLVNCASEVAPHDAKAAVDVRDGFGEMARVFAHRARRAVDDGELRFGHRRRDLGLQPDRTCLGSAGAGQGWRGTDHAARRCPSGARLAAQDIG